MTEINGWSVTADQYENGSPCWTVEKGDREASFSHYADAVQFAGVAADAVESDVVMAVRWNGTLPCHRCSAEVPASETGAIQCPKCCALLDVSSYMSPAGLFTQP